jgi:hypothetical protein
MHQVETRGTITRTRIVVMLHYLWQNLCGKILSSDTGTGFERHVISHERITHTNSSKRSDCGAQLVFFSPSSPIHTLFEYG